jgi:hypothetical protein
MPSTGLSGPYKLIDETINKIVTKRSPGVYILGYVSLNETFIIEYVGRSDDDLNKRLHDWVGKYKSFKASYSSSSKTAFEKECRIWHDFGGLRGLLDNKVHPARPIGSGWKCPICSIFD